MTDVGGGMLPVSGDSYIGVLAQSNGLNISLNTTAIKSFNIYNSGNSSVAASYNPTNNADFKIQFGNLLTAESITGTDYNYILNVNAVTSVSASSTNGTVPTSKAVVDYVDSAVAGLAGAMHYLGQKTVTVSGGTISVSGVSSPQSGDVVVADSSSTSPTAEYIYNGTAWEELGSEGIYWTKAGTITTDGIILLNNLSSSSLGAGAAFSHADSSGIASSAVKTQ